MPANGVPIEPICCQSIRKYPCCDWFTQTVNPKTGTKCPGTATLCPVRTSDPCIVSEVNSSPTHYVPPPPSPVAHTRIPTIHQTAVSAPLTPPPPTSRHPALFRTSHILTHNPNALTRRRITITLCACAVSHPSTLPAHVATATGPVATRWRGASSSPCR